MGPDERHFHEDLPELDDARLRLERHRLRTAIFLAERPSEWAVERLERIEVEIESRRAEAKREARRGR